MATSEAEHEVKREQTKIKPEIEAGGAISGPEQVDRSKSPPIDILGLLDYIIISLFFIATFVNIVYLGSDDALERLMAMQFVAIALLGAIGLGVKTRFDLLPLRNAQGEIISPSMTTTVYEIPNLDSLLDTFKWFAVAFCIQMVISFVVLRVPLSIFDLKTQYIIMGVIAGVAEELFFSYYFTSVFFVYLKYGAIFVITGVFIFYHHVIYASNLEALIYVGIMRLVYALIYLKSRRLASVALSHVLNNLLAGIM